MELLGPGAMGIVLFLRCVGLEDNNVVAGNDPGFRGGSGIRRAGRVGLVLREVLGWLAVHRLGGEVREDRAQVRVRVRETACDARGGVVGRRRNGKRIIVLSCEVR